jgi:polysaccharide biosynthesis protein PslG
MPPQPSAARSRSEFASKSCGGARPHLLALVVLLSIACGRPPAAAPDPGAKRIEFSILEDYDKGDDLTEIAKDFALFKELGVSTWRGSFGWDDFEPSRGVYDFDWLHRFADLAAAHGIVLRPYVAYTPAWAAGTGTDNEVWNDPPADLDAWSAFMRRLAGEMRRHPNVVSYEIYNEENVRQWWDGTAEGYRVVLRRGAEAVKAGNPEASVIVGGMVYADAEWIEEVCSDEVNRQTVAAIPFHAYPETWTPAGVSIENYLGAGFDQFLREVDSQCGPKPLWINEMGFATTPGKSEADQAEWWVRAIATFAAVPRLEHFGIYEIKDLPADRPVIGDAPNYHLGLTRVDRGKKLAFGTVAALVAMLGSQPVTPRVPHLEAFPPDAASVIYARLFTRADGQRWLFLWTSGQDASTTVSLPDGSRATELQLDGRAAPGAPLPIRAGRLEAVPLRLGEIRIFEIQ